MPIKEKQKIVVFKDHRQQFFDEYTGWFYDEAEDGWHIYSMSEDAYSPQGFCQYHKFTHEYPHALTDFEKRETVKHLEYKFQKYLQKMYKEANR